MPEPPEADNTSIEESVPARNAVSLPEPPALELSPRRFTAFFTAAVGPLAALSVALLLCAAVVALAGQNPLTAGSTLISGALGSRERIAESLAKMIPLLMTGLSVTIAFRAGFFNVGAEGQLLMGALAAAGLGAKLQLPIPFVLLGGAVAGAAWALIAGVLKTRRGAPEIITTIMLNYIALQIVAFSLQMPDREGAAHGWLLERAQTQPQSDVLPARSQLPALLADTNLHVGLFVALLCAGACWWFLFRTERGFLVRAAGANALAARAAGIAVEKQTLRAVALCGALSGLGGAIEIAGATKQLSMGAFGYGYTAIAVALLGNLNPLGVVPAALLFGMLDAGGKSMERIADVPAVTVFIIIGVVIFVVAALPRFSFRRS
jgi:simple sugar transport system permease protein